MKKRTLMLCLSLAILSAGCGELSKIDQIVKGAIDKKASDSSGSSQAPTAPSNEPLAKKPPSEEANERKPQKVDEDSDEDLKSELNGYIGCINRSQSRAEDSYNRYLSWVNKSAGPSCTESSLYGLYTLYDDSVEKCNAAAKRGKEGPPSLPVLEKAADDLAKCNAELIPLVKKASDYYEQQDYRDDKCAKGKEMHPQIIATFEKCFEAAKTLSNEADVLKVEMDKRTLAKLEENGPSFQSHILRFMMTAKELVKMINTEGKGPLVNKEAYVPKCLELEKNFQALDEYATAHKSEVDKTMWGSPYLSSAKEFTGKAKFLRRDLEEGKDPRSQINPFIDEYNQMINGANNLKFNFM